MKRLAVLIAAVVAGLATPASARDYGQQGATFAVIEPDFLRTIETRLTSLDQTGAIARMNEEFAKQSEAKVRRPDPVGLGLALKPRTWMFDPAITIDHDIADTKGNPIARAGQRVNPLDFITVRQKLIFIDGDVPEQVDWALAGTSELTAKIIFVKGAPLDAMTRYQRRIYFDQGGFLTRRFGIEAVPAVVEQSGALMRVSEVPVGTGKR